jgi:hypothetical protein
VEVVEAEEAEEAAEGEVLADAAAPDAADAAAAAAADIGVNEAGVRIQVEALFHQDSAEEAWPQDKYSAVVLLADSLVEARFLLFLAEHHLVRLRSVFYSIHRLPVSCPTPSLALPLQLLTRRLRHLRTLLRY